MAENGGPQELDLRRYVGALRRRLGVILTSLGAMVATALGLSYLQTPLYQGEARVLVQPEGGARLFDSQNAPDDLDPELVLETEMEILTSDHLREAVADKLGPVRKVKAERVGQSLLVALKAESTSPERAAAVANEYATTYVDLGRAQAVNELLAAGQELQAKLRDLQAEIDTIETQLASAGTGEDALRVQLERRDALVGQHARFSEKLDEVEVEASLTSGRARIVGKAAVPTSPVRPKPARNAALAGVVGLILGVGFACLLEYLDSSVRTKEEVSSLLEGVPVLGVIPAVPRWRDQRVSLAGIRRGEVPTMEAYRSLRTSLQLLGVERPLRTLQVTSPGAGEGKTTTLVGLAVAFASMGQRVVALDCDLRRPNLHNAFAIANDVGLTSVLADYSTLSEALQEVGDEKNLLVMSSGPKPVNPSELLASRSTSEVIFALQSRSDLVLIDSPPVLPVTDAAVVSSWVEGTLLVASAEATTRSHLRDAAALLRQAEASLVGAVLNGASSQDHYGYGYGDGPDDKAPRRWRVNALQPRVKTARSAGMRR